MTPSMHSKQRKLMQNILIIENRLELMIVITLNSQLATYFVYFAVWARVGVQA